MCVALGQGYRIPGGQNFDVNRNICHFGHLLQGSENLFEVGFYTHILMFYTCTMADQLIRIILGY